jgi:hypothetical protein
MAATEELAPGYASAPGGIVDKGWRKPTPRKEGIGQIPGQKGEMVTGL